MVSKPLKATHVYDKTAEYNEVAEIAVRKVFVLLGVDVDRPEAVEEFREDLRFGKRLRRAADHGFLAVIGLFAVGLAMAVWIGITSKFTGH